MDRWMNNEGLMENKGRMDGWTEDGWIGWNDGCIKKDGWIMKVRQMDKEGWMDNRWMDG